MGYRQDLEASEDRQQHSSLGSPEGTQSYCPILGLVTVREVFRLLRRLLSGHFR